MLEAMGLPKDLRVFGWGLSLERPTMIKYKVSVLLSLRIVCHRQLSKIQVNNIRELLGHKVDLAFIERNPAVRLEKT
jgi:phenylalanyl-tRNA synthetase alpha chain